MMKTALVTDAASGLGFEFSNLLAQDSFDLILVDVNEQKLKEAKRKIADCYRVRVDTIICDLCQPGCVK